MRAEIEWVPPEQGGRKARPTGDRPQGYMPIVRIEGQPWPGEVAWSLVVIKESEGPREDCWIADVRFRVDEAPHHLLGVGTWFDLYEGRRRVARGRVFAAEAARMPIEPDAESP